MRILWRSLRALLRVLRFLSRFVRSRLSTPRTMRWQREEREEKEEEKSTLKDAPDELRREKSAVLAAVSSHGLSLQYAAEDLRADRDVVLAAVKKDARALEFASVELRRSRDIVLAAVAQNADCLGMVFRDLRADREIVLLAVSRNGKLLQLASKELRSDPEVVAVAARQHTEAYRFMCQESRDFVLAVLARDWRAVRFLEPALLLDSVVAYTAVANDGLALSALPAELLLDESFWEQIAPHVADLYIFRISLLSGRSILSVWNGWDHGVWDLVQDCQRKMDRARLHEAKLFLGTQELWGTIWYWGVERGQVYDVQLVL
mmetsp:Transcript_58882/g.137578  ORF Transcript_58882/g.137578 Transcript_58882/m.137578 type:complete len:319 (+) Transcript_58882:54-1010(+)